MQIPANRFKQSLAAGREQFVAVGAEASPMVEACRTLAAEFRRGAR